jgi:hypothetical protein
VKRPSPAFGSDPPRHRRGQDFDAERRHLSSQLLSGCLIELGRHESSGGLDDNDREAAPLQRPRRFQSEQAPADDRSRVCRLRLRMNQPQIPSIGGT